MRGTKKGQIHPVFAARLQELRQQASTIAGAYSGTAVRNWQVPSGLQTDLLVVPLLHVPAFNRQPINDNYIDAMKSSTDPGTVGDIVSLKQQLDYNAAEERAFRMRHASLGRCLAFAAGRRHGHGVGDVFPLVEQQAANLLAAGGV